MLERLKPRETGGPLSSTAFNLLNALGFYHEGVEDKAAPEPFFAIIDGKPWQFTYDDTHVARCVERPELSAIVYEPTDEQGQVTGGACIYGQAQIMEDLAVQGFRVDDESLAEAEANYHTFHEHGNEQAQLN